MDFPPPSVPSRRSALRALVAGAAAVAAGALRPEALLGRARDVAGDAAAPPLGLQLYTVRALLARDPLGTLDALQRIGIREVEFAGHHGLTPAAWREALDARGMTAPAAHVGLPAAPEAWTTIIADARVLGHRWIVIPWVGEAVRASRASWLAFARQLDDAGARLADAGLRLAYHNHEFEFAPLDGVLPHTLLREHTDAARVDFELDLYWAVKAGQDPASLLADFGARVPLWHLKDAGPAPERAMRDVGAGTIDFAALFASPHASALRHGFIEHDQPADALASVRASAAALAR